MRTLLTACLATTLIYATIFAAPQTSQAKQSSPAPQAKTSPANTSGVGVRTFGTPRQAADALVVAARTFDIGLLDALFGPETTKGVLLSGEEALDRQRAADFAAMADEKIVVSVDPKTGTRAFMVVGNSDWPFPVPIVKRGAAWSFDTKAGRQELLYRRIGGNELDAIRICRGYVEAQNEYALQPRQGFDVNQYAQRIISRPGTQDGLAWQTAKGTWDGPLGENIANAIQHGYSTRAQPYHGYFFKTLKGQGPAAPLGEMDYVINGVMIGGFALAAAPAEYGVTGVKTFIVSQDGVVYEKDLGTATSGAFATLERFNPDRSWTPVTVEE